MASQKMGMIMGILFLLSACTTLKNKDQIPSNTTVDGQQTFLAIANKSISQPVEQNSCFGSGCHQAFEIGNSDSVHKPFQADQCDKCHSANPHEQRINWTATDELLLCYSCHSIESLGNSHPVGKGVIDPNTNKEVTCISCHSPHYSNHSFQLILDGRGELCLHCHKEFITK
jgi:predicted CXXCH cytochrome family protein